jgi:hypothetical protein
MDTLRPATPSPARPAALVVIVAPPPAAPAAQRSRPLSPSRPRALTVPLALLPTPPHPPTLHLTNPPKERRLLECWVAKARRAGLARHQIVTWVRRKVGGHVTVFRTLADGTLACAAPCLLCQRELVRFDLRVHCSLSHEAWFSGRLTDEAAPPGKLTARQRMMMPSNDPAQQPEAERGGGAGAGEGGSGSGSDSGGSGDAAAARRERGWHSSGGRSHKRNLSP